jgi:molecular chaperone DnaK
MSIKAIGIDFGTSTSEICVYQHDRPYPIPDAGTKSPIIPSVVAINKQGELVVGSQAESHLDAVREIKRLLGSSETIMLGNKPCRPEEVAALVLKYMAKQAELYLGVPVTDVIVSVPANFDEAKRNATLQAGTIAGLNIQRLISEPTAAAIAFGHDHLEANEQMAVFDFGGGTLDVTILEMVEGILDVKATYGDPKLGGKDFDDIMIQLIMEKFRIQYPNAQIGEKSRAALKPLAKRIKEDLSNVNASTATSVNFTVISGAPVDLEVDITRAEYESRCSDLLQRARAVVDATFHKAGVLKSSIVRVLLVGGTTYMPCVRELVRSTFDKEPSHDVNPDLAVSLGACVQHAIAQNLVKNNSVIVLDNTAFGLGLKCVTIMGGQLVPEAYDALICPNQRIPFSCTKTYHLMHDQQAKVNIELYQDHLGVAKFCKDAIFTGIDGDIEDIPPSLTGKPHSIDVEFCYDLSGLVQLTARIAATNQMCIIKLNAHESRLSETQKIQAQQRVEELFASNPHYADRYQAILAKARAEIADADSQHARQITDRVAALEAAIQQRDDATAEQAADGLADVLFNM